MKGKLLATQLSSGVSQISYVAGATISQSRPSRQRSRDSIGADNIIHETRLVQTILSMKNDWRRRRSSNKALFAIFLRKRVQTNEGEEEEEDDFNVSQPKARDFGSRVVSRKQERRCRSLLRRDQKMGQQSYIWRLREAKVTLKG